MRTRKLAIAEAKQFAQQMKSTYRKTSYIKPQTQDNIVETYTGLTAKTFKERWNVHNSNFRTEANKKPTKLSSLIWKLKN